MVSVPGLDGGDLEPGTGIASDHLDPIVRVSECEGSIRLRRMLHDVVQRLLRDPVHGGLDILPQAARFPVEDEVDRSPSPLAGRLREAMGRIDETVLELKRSEIEDQSA